LLALILVAGVAEVGLHELCLLLIVAAVVDMPVLHPSSCLVVDNGASALKAGFSNWSGPRVLPNSICKAKSEKRRAFVADQIDDCRDLSSLFYLLPFQKGYLVNWDHQKTVWDYVFGSSCLNFDPSAKEVVITEPYFNFNSIQVR